MDLTIAKNAKIHTRGHYKVTGLDNPGLDIDAKVRYNSDLYQSTL
jgi:hypothetical protein